MKTLKKLTTKVTQHNDDHPQGSQSTTPSHNDPSSAMSELMLSVGEAEKVLDDLHVPELHVAVGSLLEALKSIKVCSQYMHLYSYIIF